MGPPWVPDFQLRLVQNDPRVVWFPGITHWPIQAIGPHRYLDTPLYHTDLLLNPVERRRAKVRRYEAAIPGRRVAGLPMNDAYFLPEDREGVRLEPVDAADRDTIGRILELDPWPEPRPGAKPVRTATRDEVDVHWHGAPATEALYRGALELVDEVAPFALGEQRGVVVRVANRSTHVWPHDGVGWPSVRIAYRWLDDEGAVVVADGLRTALPATLAPEASLVVPADVQAPPVAGRHTLVLDLLHEHVRWFGCDAPGGGGRAARALRRDPRSRRGHGPGRRGNARGGGALSFARSSSRHRPGRTTRAPRLRRRRGRPRVRPRDGRRPRQARRRRPGR